MTNSTKSEALNQRLVNLSEKQINGVLMGMSEHIGTMQIEPLIDSIFWDPTYINMSEEDLQKEATRLGEWFGNTIYFPKDKYVNAVTNYFNSNLQSKDSYWLNLESKLDWVKDQLTKDYNTSEDVEWIQSLLDSPLSIDTVHQMVLKNLEEKYETNS